jgi:4-hydroxy-3-methylbut-2-en-1-yl diphosphate synthase IspG/GcpE
VGLGALLSQGIGDTIRVSLSADPTEEVRVGIDILKSLGLRKGGLTFVSVPVVRPRGRGSREARRESRGRVQAA